MTYVNFINGFGVIGMLTLRNFRNAKFKCINFAMTFSHICSCKFICEKMLRHDNSMNIYNKLLKKNRRNSSSVLYEKFNFEPKIRRKSISI